MLGQHIRTVLWCWTGLHQYPFVENFKLNNYSQWTVFIPHRGVFILARVEKPFKNKLNGLFLYSCLDYLLVTEHTNNQPPVNAQHVSLYLWLRSHLHVDWSLAMWDELRTATSWLIHLHGPATWGRPSLSPLLTNRRQTHETPSKCDHSWGKSPWPSPDTLLSTSNPRPLLIVDQLHAFFMTTAFTY